MMRVSCPHCGRDLYSSTFRIGQVVTCSYSDCEKTFTVDKILPIHDQENEKANGQSDQSRRD